MKLVLHTGSPSLIPGAYSRLRKIGQKFETEKEMIEKAFAIYKEAMSHDVEIFCNLNIVYDALRLAHVREFAARPFSGMRFFVHLYEKDKPVRFVEVNRLGVESVDDDVFSDSMYLLEKILTTKCATRTAEKKGLTPITNITEVEHGSPNTEINSHAS
jgi:hypothetical protein